MIKTFSFKRQIWKRLCKNWGAMFGLVLISIAILISVFGYWIAPDATPNADMQTVEIQAKSPGYSQLFLKIPDKKIVSVGWFANLIGGRESDFKYLPITKYRLQGDSIQVNKLVDEDTSTLQSFSINLFKNEAGQQGAANYIVTKKYYLGTDKFGRDILSRLIIGTKVSVAVGLIAVLISLTIGILFGAIAGYYRGWADEVIMWLVNTTWSIPTLLLVFAFTMALGKGFWQIFIAVGLTMWVSVARLIRGQIMALKQLEYIQAAKALGLSDGRIIIKHMLPNILGPLLVIAASNFATAIIIEAGLSFLGIGVQPPQPSWGLMIKENYNFIITHQPMLALVPGFAIMLLVLAFNLLGNGLRDAVDVRSEY